MSEAVAINKGDILSIEASNGESIEAIAYENVLYPYDEIFVVYSIDDECCLTVHGYNMSNIEVINVQKN